MSTIYRIVMHRDAADRVIEEATEVIPGSVLPGPATYFVHEVVGVRGPQGAIPLQIRVPCPGATDVHVAFEMIGDDTYRARVDAAAGAEMRRREELARKHSLAMGIPQ